MLDSASGLKKTSDDPTYDLHGFSSTFHMSLMCNLGPVLLPWVPGWAVSQKVYNTQLIKVDGAYTMSYNSHCEHSAKCMFDHRVVPNDLVRLASENTDDSK